MDKIQSQRIIKETCENPFDQDRFNRFIKNLLKRFEESSFSYQGCYIPDSFSNNISSYERIGKYSDGDNRIDILVVKLRRESSIERARTMQRNFIAGYLAGKYGSDVQKEAALVAFVAPSEADWRFSLVKLDYRFEEGKQGRMKVIDEYTPARRWSFLVGENEVSHTAQSKLMPIMMNDEQCPTLAQLEEAFNVEKVSKEFFEKYRELFIWTKDELDKVIKNDSQAQKDFESKGVDTVNFAKKLLGQIVFLYFLQKKGWFGVNRDADWGTGSKQYLRELFSKKPSKYDNFFNDILEPLFYEALRIDRTHDDDYYSRFNSKIPFLNGGLFDPINNYDWVHTDILLPNDLFSNNKKTKEGDIGNGILDIFDRYNFTVKEDEPLDKEVAIDPEMLGKAYEKFNAIRPDNYDEYVKALKGGTKGAESKFNKQYGVYYTPREIVHYMCQQSLINYLDTELNQGAVGFEKLGDPQVDAFGNKTKKGQQDLTIEHGVRPTTQKRDIEILIKHGEYVSENEERVLKEGKETDTYYHKLPESIRENAELIDEKLAIIKVCDPAVGSGAFPVGMMTEIVKTRNVLSTFLSLRGAVTTKQSRTIYNFKRECIEKSLYGVDIDSGAVEIAKLRLWLSLVVDEEDIRQIKPLPNLDYKVVCGNSLLGFPDDWNSPIAKDIENLKKQFFTETNPKRKNELKKSIDEKIHARHSNSHKYFGYQVDFDFKTAFSEVFHQKNGFDVVIANPPYGETIKNNKDYFKNNFCCSEGKFEIYKFFIEKGLKLLCNKGTLCYITPDTWLRLNYFTKLREFIMKNFNLYKLSKSLYEVFEVVTVDTVISFIQKDKNSENFILVGSDLMGEHLISKNIHQEQYIVSADEKNSVISKLDSLQNRLSSVCDVTQGLIAYHSKKQKRIWTSKEKETEFHRTILYGGDIGKFHIKWSGDYLKYGSWLHRKRPDYVFDNEKILVQRIRNPRLSDRIIAAYDCDRYLNTNGLSNILDLESPKFPVFLKFILAILNSKLINYWFSFYYKDVNIKPAQLRTMPVPKILKEEQLPIVNIVDKILAVTKDDDYLRSSTKHAKVKEYEDQIDQLVYELYGLTDEEIKIVEDFYKK